MQMFIDYAAVVYQTYGLPPFVIGGLLALAILVFIFRQIGVASYTFPALILMAIFGLIFVPQSIFDAIITGSGSEEARARIADLEALVPARYIAAPVLALTAIILLRGRFTIPVLVLAVGLTYLIEGKLNPTSLASMGLPTVNIPDIDLLNLEQIQLGGGGPSGVSKSVSGLAGSIPLGN